MKSIILDDNKWDMLLEKLLDDYPTSSIVIREKMKQKLGFTRRYHLVIIKDEYGTQYKREVHLDFYDDKKRTMFELKYCDYI